MKVITSVNRPYLRLLQLWIAQSARHCPGKPVVVCMDEASADFCADQPVEVFRPTTRGVASNRDRHSFWGQRLSAIRELLDANTAIVHSDLDAFWLENPASLLESIDADLIFSKDMGIPDNIRQAWGFVLCCGLFMARNTAATRALFDRWQARTNQQGDDQIALNGLLFEQQPVWHKDARTDLEILRSEIEIDGQNLRIAVLPLSHFTRVVPVAANGAMVAHPWFERSLFVNYLDLLAFTLKRFQRLDPPEAWLQPLPDITVDLDECSLGTLKSLHFALREQPQSASFLTLRGAMYLRAQRSDLALADFRLAESLGEPTVALRLYLAESLLLTGDLPAAVALVVPLAGNQELELPSIRKAATILFKAKRPVAALWFLKDALRGFGLGRSLSMGRTWLKKRLSNAIS